MDKSDILSRRLKSFKINTENTKAIEKCNMLSMAEQHPQAIICSILFTWELMIGKILLMNKKFSQWVCAMR